MSASNTSPRPRWIEPGDVRGLTEGSVVVGPVLLFDWTYLGVHNTALRFVIENTGAGVLTVTPEAAYHILGPPEVGNFAPAPFTVQPGDVYGDPYGIDEMRPFWRLWIAGTSTYKWGVMGIPR